MLLGYESALRLGVVGIFLVLGEVVDGFGVLGYMLRELGIFLGFGFGGVYVPLPVPLPPSCGNFAVGDIFIAAFASCLRFFFSIMIIPLSLLYSYISIVLKPPP